MPRQSDSEQEFQRLSEMMKDPRYWRDKDTAYVAKVTEGFQRLFDTADAQGRAERGQAANASGVTGRAHARDVIIGHLALGEIVVPPHALSPAVMAALRQELGDQLPRFIVGSGFERRNPVSGLPAFSPENEEESASFADWLTEHVGGVFDTLQSFLKGRAGRPPLGAPDPADRLRREPASRALDPFGLRDEVPRDHAPSTGQPRRGGGRKCTPLERADPLSPCYLEPQS